MMTEPDHEVFVNDENTFRCREIQCVLPGTKGTSWLWASLSRTIMRRGVAPDHVPYIMMLTVLASLAVNPGKEDRKSTRLNSSHSH